MATDAAGFIYIADADDHRIRRIDTSGRIQTIAGEGLPGFSGDGGPASRARIHTPYGITITPAGDIVFADLGNARVRRISRSGQIDTLVGGGTREIPAAGQFAGPREVRLGAPRNVLASASGSLFISDFSANVVLELRSDGQLTAMPNSSVGLNSPAGLALDADGQLLVADSGNARIRRLRRDGRLDLLLSASAAAPLERPVGLARQRNGNLLIADTRGAFLWQLDPQGRTSIVPPGGRDVATDSFDNILTAGGSWLRRISPQGLIEILISNTFSRFRGDHGPALGARLNRPQGIAVDSRGQIYFSDTANHRIRRINTDGVITTVAGLGEPGYRGDGGPAASALIHTPTYIGIDSLDNVYFSDSGNHRVRVFTPGGGIQTAAGTGRNEFSSDGLLASQTSLSHPQGLAFDRAGRLCIAERGQHRIRRIEGNGRVSTIAGNSVRGAAGDGFEAIAASLNQPTAIALDAQGSLFIADSGNQSVRAVDSASGRIRTLIRDLAGVEGLAATPNGVLYISETLRHRVQSLNLNNELTVIAGRTNENGFNTDAGPALSVTLNEPAGLALAPDGSLLLADRLNDRLRRIEPPIAVQASNSSVFRVLHAATFAEGPIAPGQLLTLSGPALARPDLAEITIEGQAAPILFANPTQINFQVPYALSGRSRVQLDLRMGGSLLFRAQIDMAGANPAFFESAEVIVATFPDGRLVSDAAPGRSGDTIILYGTGEGLLRDASGLQVTFLPTTVEIAGVPADLLYAGAAPGFAGLLQVNLRVPANIRLRGRVPVTLRVGAFRNPPNQLLVIQ
ncbi:MAG: IPT/TIG domain-containing protein [Acidobacteriota bacterium]